MGDNTSSMIDYKYIILGVAFDWGRRKGIDVFEQLRHVLTPDYCIVLVGVDEKTKGKLSQGIFCIPKTKSQSELAALYSSADVLVNPTREDNFPTVNIEALACGTPVVTFNTGGSAEMIDESCGISVEQDDFNSLVSAIREVCENNAINRDNCIRRSKLFDQNKKFKEYIELYKFILAGNNNE